jgi:anaerobic ribonucleoside-triphosphate reductase activating protein
MKKGYVRLAYDGIQTDSIVDGAGIRAVIWFQGCGHACPECHNPETWDFKAGIEKSIASVKKEIKALEYQDGVTFSGGDPLYQIDALIELAKCVKECGMNVWVYTGFTWEEVMDLAKENPKYLEALKYIDILVDGRFVIALRSFDVEFRGSSNQRIIDVAKSLEAGKVVKVEKYK